MDAIIQQFFNVAIMEQAFPLILAGLKQTIIICLIVVPLGLIGGLAVALISLSRWRTARWAVIAWIDLFRSVPPLVLLIFVYAGLPFAGLRLSPMAAVAIAFFLNASSYYGEIYRAGIESVGLGQWDAARSTGFARLSDARLCSLAASRAKRVARSGVQYRRSGEAHVDRQRRGAAGIAVFGRHGAVGDLQLVADRAGCGDLPCYVVAGGAADQPVGAADRGMNCWRVS